MRILMRNHSKSVVLHEKLAGKLKMSGFVDKSPFFDQKFTENEKKMTRKV